MRTFLTLGSILPILIESMGYSNQLSWRERALLPCPRAGYMAGVIDGRYVVAGGSYWQNNRKVWTSRVDAFDPNTNTWSERVSLPEPRSDAACVTLENNFYMFGGMGNDGARTDAMVLEHGSWKSVPEATLPEPRIYSVAVVSGDSIYIVGGLSKTGDYTSTRNTIWRWNSKLREKGWEILQPFPGPGLVNLAVAVTGQNIYVLGGAKTGGENLVNSNSAFVFDCRTERWTRLPDLPFARRCWWAVPLDGRVLLVGGYTESYEKEVCEYDLISRSLRQVGFLPHGVCDAKFLRIGNSLIGTGGEVGDKIRGKWTFESQLPPA